MPPADSVWPAFPQAITKFAWRRPALRSASQRFKLTARDRAVVSVLLHVGAMDEAVVVDAMPGRIRLGGNAGVLRQFEAGALMAGLGGALAGVPGAGLTLHEQMGRFDGTTLGTGNLVLAAKASLPLNGRIALEAPTHVRSYFPEALYINPQIITDQNGAATISIPMADSITTWRMAMMASTTHGALGSGTASLKVFQDFFVDLDLPVTLTQGDRVDIPVAIYNYAGTKGNVHLHLEPADWFSLPEDVPDKSLNVEPDRVGASHFTLEAKRIGKFKLTLAARMIGETDRADVVIREIEVIPNGREQNQVFNGRLEAAAHQELNFPAASISGASAIFVRLYPGPLSQVIEGMDAILRMPGGCFEQTSSSTYPNVLALDYMKRIQKLTPEVHAKAEGFIANGYQRLLTFEVPGGGFSWFGKRTGKQDPDRIRADGILRHGQGSRRGCEDHRIGPSSGWPDSSSRMEAGNPTHPLLMKAPRIDTIPMPCASLRTSHGRLRIRAIGDRPSKRLASLSKAT